MGGIKIPSIDELSEEDLVNIVDQIIQFASRNTQAQERTTYDFKEKIGHDNDKERHEIRKDFSAFANTNGGLLIIGVVNGSLKVQGVSPSSLIGQDALTQILSVKTQIVPPIGGECHSREIKYQGVTLQILEVSPTDALVEVKDPKSGRWVSWCRENSTSREMTVNEVLRKLAKRAFSLPSRLRVDPSKLGVYLVPNLNPAPRIEWDLRSQAALYQFLRLPYGHLLPLPLVTPWCPVNRESYVASSRYLGESEDVYEVLDQIERVTQSSFGIGFEVWTVPVAGARTYTEDHRYAAGSGAASLISTVRERVRIQPYVRFGWGVLTGSVFQIVTGFVDGSHSNIVVTSFLNSVPNGFDFVSISPEGRVMPNRLPVHEYRRENELDAKRILESRLRFSPADTTESDESPSVMGVSVVGFLGSEPEPLTYGGLVGRKGLTLFKFDDSCTLEPDTTPLVSHASVLFGCISNRPMGLNPFKPLSLHSLKSWAFPLAVDIASDTTVILFGNAIGLNQEDKHLLTPDVQSQPPGSSSTVTGTGQPV